MAESEAKVENPIARKLANIFENQLINDNVGK